MSGQPSYASVPAYLDQECGNQNWKYLARGSFGAVFKCGADRALKVQNATSDEQLRDIMSENAVPTDIARECNLPPPLTCSVLQPTGDLDIFQDQQSGQRMAVSKLPFIAGGDGTLLSENFENAKRWTVANFLKNYNNLIHTLFEMHRIGVIHRDIKPANILLQQLSPGQYKLFLSDYGGACLFQPNPDIGDVPSCNESPGFGTIYYEDPYALFANRNESWNVPTIDMYSLGLTLWEMLTAAQYLPESLYNGLGDVRNLGQLQRQDLAKRLTRNHIEQSKFLVDNMLRKLQRNPQLSMRAKQNWLQAMKNIIDMTRPFAVAQRPTAQQIIQEQGPSDQR